MKYKYILINLTLFTISLSLILLITEFALSVFWPHKITARPFYHIQDFFCEYSPVMGWKNKPNYCGKVVVTKKHSFTVTHNSRGHRGREHIFNKDGNIYRILALGDSFVWGFGVNDDEVFTNRIESMVQNIEAINMGVTGYGTDQELLYYIKKGPLYEHDLVLLVIYPNDIGEISSTISYGYPKPMFDISADPLEVINVPVPQTHETERQLFGNPKSTLGKIKKYLRRNTHTYPLIANRLNSIEWLRKLLIRAGISKEYGFGTLRVPYYEINDMDKIIDLFLKLIIKFKLEAAENNSEFLLVFVPIRESPQGNPLGYEDIAGWEPSYNDSILQNLHKFTKENQINFINLLDPIRKGHDKGIKYYSSHERDIHLNAEGHRLLAKEIVAWLSSNGLLENDL